MSGGSLVFVDQAAQDWVSAGLPGAGVGCGDAGSGARVGNGVGTEISPIVGTAVGAPAAAAGGDAGAGTAVAVGTGVGVQAGGGGMTAVGTWPLTGVGAAFK